MVWGATNDEDLMQPAARQNTEPTIWITDAELIRRMGVPEKIARRCLRKLDANPRLGFPRKSKFWGGRRNWLLCKGYFQRMPGGMMAGSTGGIEDDD
jgi:hypothetical protein